MRRKDKNCVEKQEGVFFQQVAGHEIRECEKCVGGILEMAEERWVQAKGYIIGYIRYIS